MISHIIFSVRELLHHNESAAVPISLSLDFSSINKLKNHPAVMEYSNFLNDYSPNVIIKKLQSFFVSCKVLMNADMVSILLLCLINCFTLVHCSVSLLYFKLYSS